MVQAVCKNRKIVDVLAIANYNGRIESEDCRRLWLMIDCYKEIRYFSPKAADGHVNY
jgi:hypothetical protein